jgi:hypothetical protein
MIYLRDSAKMPLQIVLRNLLMLDVGFDALLTTRTRSPRG